MQLIPIVHRKYSNPNHLEDLEWLQEQRDKGAFISVKDYRKKILGEKADEMVFADDFAVTLEISACQYFPYVRMIAESAIENQMLMPGRFIRVRKMKEQEEDGDLAAFAAAMQIFGASYVETLDTKGTDGSNIHLGGPATITGYFGGVGQPNKHALKWLDEFLYYYTTYGIRQVLNINPGTVFLGYLLHQLGVDNEFKISVYMGNDNPYAALWTLLGAKPMSISDFLKREDRTKITAAFPKTQLKRNLRRWLFLIILSSRIPQPWMNTIIFLNPIMLSVSTNKPSLSKAL